MISGSLLENQNMSLCMESQEGGASCPDGQGVWDWESEILLKMRKDHLNTNFNFA